MHPEHTSILIGDPQSGSSAPEEPVKRDRNAEQRQQKRALYMQNTTVRKCLGCEGEFRSEGIHNRLCSRCRSRR